MEIIKAIEAEDAVKLFGIIFGAILIVIGLIGLLAVKCETRCLLCVYMVFIILITVAFIVVWIVIQVVLGSKKEDLDEICDNAGRSGWLDEVYKIYPKAVCGDSIHDPSYGLGSCPNNGVTKICFGAKRIQDCSESEKAIIYEGLDKIPSDVYIELAKYLEEEKECIGICSLCPHYMYSDCNHGDFNTPSCDQVVTDLITDNAAIVAGISAVCTVLGIFIVIATFCLCCHKKFNAKTENEEQK